MVDKSATLKLQIITNSGAYHQFDSDTSVNIRYDVGTGQGVHCGGFERQAQHRKHRQQRPHERETQVR